MTLNLVDMNAHSDIVQLDTAAVGAKLGVSANTVRRYMMADRDKYGFPAPDGHLGRSPWWLPETIDAWIATRPGKGAGAGRPRKDPAGPERRHPAEVTASRLLTAVELWGPAGAGKLEGKELDAIGAVRFALHEIAEGAR